MRAMVCDWCAAVAVDYDGWYEVGPVGTGRDVPFAESPRTFCGLDCLGDFVDDARTSPTGQVTGAAAVPAAVDPSSVHATTTAPTAPALDADVPIPAVEPVRTEPSRRPVVVMAVADPPTDEVRESVPAAALAAAPPPLRGLGRGLGRTGS